MKKTNKELIAAALCVTLIVASLAVFLTRGSNAAEYPILYCNDEAWWLDSLASVEYSDGVMFIPIDAFTRVSRIDATIDTERGSYMLRNTETEEYVSIKSDNKMVLHSGTSIFRIDCYERASKYYNYFYIPAERIASLIDCTIETYTAPSGRTYVRICDGSQKMSFSDVLRKYVPDEFPGATSNQLPVTQEPVTSEPTPPPQTVRKQICITFDGIGQNTEDMLVLLKSYGVKATFFLSESDIVNNPMTVVRIYSEGHAIGVLSDAEGSLASACDALVSVISCRSRITRISGSVPDIRFKDGYITVVGAFSVNEHLQPTSALSVIQSYVSNNSSPVLRFTSSLSAVEIVGLLLRAYEASTEVCFRTVGLD